ncbi:MAG: histidine kinase, partial [Rhodocyclales bacterium]|nr:histidine kinase [Rhodocyclales bacterium]
TNLRLEEKVAERTRDLTALLKKMEDAQNQILQSEKMAAIGQLAAGVAHEINNPIGFVNSNLGTLKNYVEQLLGLIDIYDQTVAKAPIQAPQLAAAKQEVDLDFLRSDIVALLAESREGLERVKKIVQDLKDFSHVDEAELQEADINAGLDSTLNVVWNELKYKTEIVKQYGQLPPVRCIPGQLNQVFMNLLINAAQAIEQHGTITLRSGIKGKEIWVEVADTGRGMTPEVLHRVFEPFFTTKPVGKGTGLGLSLSYDIIVKKHGGRFEVDSAPGKGSTFRIWLPIGAPVS